jgi:hypothetical protein
VRAALEAFGNTDTAVVREEHVGRFTVVLLDRSGAAGETYAIRGSDPHDLPLLAILRDGAVEWHETDAYWEILSIGAQGLGPGRPGMIVKSQAGAVHCCLGLYAFALGESFRPFPKIVVPHGTAERLSHLPGHRPTIEVLDDVLAGWRSAYTISPMAAVQLTPGDDGWITMPDLMRSDSAGGCPRARTLRGETACPLLAHSTDVPGGRIFALGTDPAALAKQIRAYLDKERQAPAELMGVVLRLLYTGHGAKSWYYVNDNWPPEVPGRDEFIRDFSVRLLASQWWDDLFGLNGPALIQPALQAVAPSPTATDSRDTMSGKGWDDTGTEWTVITRWDGHAPTLFAFVGCDVGATAGTARVRLIDPVRRIAKSVDFEGCLASFRLGDDEPAVVDGAGNTVARLPPR